MRTVALADGADFEGWRASARTLLSDEVLPDQVNWVVRGEASLLLDQMGPAPAIPTRPAPRISAEFLALMQSLICYSDPQRYGLAYRMLWRLTHGERSLLQLITDGDVVRARNAEKSVRRDSHKMKAFVRFREMTAEDGQTVFVAWFEPSHYIVERVAPFFVRRFTGMCWSILTPYRSAHWDGATLQYSPGATKADAPSADVLEDYWRTYYASIFNPARLKVQAMKSEMPMKYWKNLPEAQLIPALVREARPRTLAMVEAAATVPKKRIAPVAMVAIAPTRQGSLAALRAEAKNCRACALWQPATQTVFGEGPENARLMLVSDQPSDRDDLAGNPFTGPAGKLLDRALQAAGLDRGALYLTYTVKHFKFTTRNIFRQQQGASAEEQAACRPWLDAEMALVRPQLIVCLGHVAAGQLMEAESGHLAVRGQWQRWPDGTRRMATAHPADLLRLEGSDAHRDFVAELAQAKMAIDTLLAACPCGSAQAYADCCEPLHAGATAVTAEALMRSRYAAFVLGLANYLMESWHASTRPATLALESGVKWLGLSIKVHHRTGPDSATVEFVARSRQGGGPAQRLHEVSRFVREDGRWFYVDGIIS